MFGELDTSSHRRVFILLAIFSVLMAFGFHVYVAYSMGVAKQMPGWVVDAIPSALSETVFNHQKRYTSLSDVEKMFAGRTNAAADLNERIDCVRGLNPTSVGQHYVLLGNDDNQNTGRVSGPTSQFIAAIRRDTRLDLLRRPW